MIRLRLSSYLRRGPAGHVSITLGTSILIQALNVATGILTARLLGPAGKGELTAVMLWPMIFVVLGSLGLSGALTYYGAQDSGGSNAVLATSILVGLVQSAALMLLGLLLVPWVLQNEGRQVVQTAALYFVYVPLGLLTLYLQSYLGARLKFGAYNLVRIAYGGTSFALLVGLTVLRLATVGSLALAYLVSNLLTLAVAGILVWRAGYIGWSWNLRLIGPLITYGLKSHLSTVALSINERMDQLLISAFLAPRQLGLYAVAVTLNTPIVLIGTSIASVAFPAIAAIEGDAERRRCFYRYVRITVWLSVICAGLMMSVSTAMLKLVFGEQYLPAAGVSQVLIIAAVPLGVNRIFQAGFRALNEPLVAGVSETIAALLTASLLFALLPGYGIIAAGWISLGAYSVSLAYMLQRIVKVPGVRVGDLLLPDVHDWGFVAGIWRYLGA